MDQCCDRCREAPQGEAGHDELRFYVGGPYPGQNIFKCEACGERWIRHHGGEQRFGWTRYAAALVTGIRRPTRAVKGELGVRP